MTRADSKQPDSPKPIDSDEFIESSIGYHLRQAHLATFRHFVRTAAEPITPTQLVILLRIDAHPGLSQSDLGNFLGLDRATTMAIVRKLQSREWLSRRRSAADKRKYELQLTPRGLTALRRFLVVQRQVETELTAQLTVREQDQLLKLLKKLTCSSGPAAE